MNRIRFFIGLIAVGVCALVYVAVAQTGNNQLFLKGTIQSPNVGEVSLSGVVPTTGAPYGILYDEASHELSGYAWSSGVGWIRFDPAGPFPSDRNDITPHDFPATIVSGEFQGWARACAVFPEGSCAGALRPDTERGGWDGWIKLSGDADIANASGSKRYHVTETNGTIEGWAWSDNVLGWMQFAASFSAGGPGTGTSTTSTTPGTPGSGGPLTVQLTPDPRSGRIPLSVMLTATAIGAPAGTRYHYRFDCQNDGRPDIEDLIEDLNVADAIHTASRSCVYQTAANYVAFVSVEEVTGTYTTGTALTAIRALPKGPIETNPR